MVSSEDNLILGAMLDSIYHRGPNSEGRLLENRLAMGMRRLAIIDLDGGEQPIHNEGKEISVIFNGEIYNFSVLRQELEKKGHKFSSQTDTEVIVHLYEEYGEKICSKLDGMFAFCIYDRRENCLFFARDRSGKKPLYYSMTDSCFLFGSELNTLMVHPFLKRELNLESVAKYFSYGYVPAPATILKNVKKLPAGHFMTLSCNSFNIKSQCYWDFDCTNKTKSDEKTIMKDLEQELYTAVEKRLVSDVPLGVFLSGGVDSSLIVALMSEFKESKAIKTFSIGFSDQRFDESYYAKIVADLYQTDHHMKIFTMDEAFNMIDEAIDIMGEPLSDPSILPTYLLSKFTRQNGVIVALSGDGSDELFGGYPKYWIHKYAKIYDLFPRNINRWVINPLFHMVRLKPTNNIFNYKVDRFLANVQYQPIHRNQFWVSPFIPEEVVDQLLFKAGVTQKMLFKDADFHSRNFQGNDFLDKMMYLDQKMMLQDMYLTKVDRASMGASIEVRSPFLDTAVMEYASSIPSQYKVKGRETKYILKKIAETKLPQEIVYRFKKGFGVPLAFWLKKMSGEILSLLERSTVGFLNKTYAKQLINEHANDKGDHATKIWSIFVFLKWHEKWID